MSEKNDIPMYFPQLLQCGDKAISSGGVSLRDWFAGQALAGAMACSDEAVMSKEQAAFIATEAYLMADAMLAERSKQ